MEIMNRKPKDRIDELIEQIIDINKNILNKLKNQYDNRLERLC